MKKILLIFFILCLSGCTEREVKTIIEEDKDLVSINYPVTGINVLDDAVSSYVNKTYKNFKKDYTGIKKAELNISYTYKEVNESIVNISLNTFIGADKTVNKIKTFTYDKKSKKFLSMEDLISDLDALDYDVKKALLEKYREADMDFLSNVSYDYFTIDDENLTIYLGPAILKGNGSELIYLDIPLDTLDMLIDVDKSKASDNYLYIKKRNIDYGDKVVALTFDDGPSKYTNDIIDILKKNDACGTFFVVGNKVSFYDQTLVKMVKNGNEIGNHSYSHKWLNRLSADEFKKEINRTQDEVKKVTGFTPKLFRPTYGGYTDRLKSYTDLLFVLWDVDSSDWKVKRKDKILKNVIPNVKDGSIILFHDNHEYAALAIESVIQELADDGYKFVTVSELLEIKELREQE